MMHQKILILDFGAQYTQLIARRVREARVYCEIHPYDVSDAVRARFRRQRRDPVGQPHVGDRGGDGASAAGGVRLGRAGAGHLLRHADHGRTTRRQGRGGQGPRIRLCRGARARPHAPVRRHRGLPHARGPRHAQGVDEPRRQSHAVPAGLQAHGLDRRLPDRRAWPTKSAASTRCSSTPRSRTRFRARRSSGASSTISAAAPATGTCPTTSSEAIARIREQVGRDEVILGLSGGVDSSVAAALIHRAIGDQLTCVFVDHGLLRLNEGEQVMATFAGAWASR